MDVSDVFLLLIICAGLIFLSQYAGLQRFYLNLLDQGKILTEITLGWMAACLILLSFYLQPIASLQLVASLSNPVQART